MARWFHAPHTGINIIIIIIKQELRAKIDRRKRHKCAATAQLLTNNSHLITARK